MSEQLYKVIDSVGREWQMRPLPGHFFVMFGQLPASLSNQAAEALQKGKTDDLQKEVTAKLSEKEILDLMILTREAVKYACVKPRITLSPTNEDEISPFEISEEDFQFLAKSALQSKGGQAEGLKSFRREPAKTSRSRANRKK